MDKKEQKLKKDFNQSVTAGTIFLHMVREASGLAALVIVLTFIFADNPTTKFVKYGSIAAALGAISGLHTGVSKKLQSTDPKKGPDLN